MGNTWFLWYRCAFSFGFFFVLCLVGGGGFYDNWNLESQEILPSLRTFTNEAERTLDLPRRRSRHVVVVGPFEEEEEGTGVVSDVLKAKAEDPDTPG